MIYFARGRRQQSSFWVAAVLVGALWLSFQKAALAGDEKSDGAGVPSEAPVQLVQSVPLETPFQQPGIPMTGDVWVEMIRNAKISIDLAQFYVSNGQVKVSGSKKSLEKKPLEPVMEELEKAGKRGVRIRLLVSSSLLNEDPVTLERFKKIRGAEVRVLDMSQISGGVLHAKYWVVDSKEIFVGSQNFDWRSLTQIHELGVRVQDFQVARQLGRIFNADWKLSRKGDVQSLAYYSNTPTPGKTIELVASPPQLTPSDVRPAIQALVETLDGAKKSIQVQLMDYSPLAGNQTYWPDLDNALRAASSRGVKVQILLAQSTTTLKAIGYLKSLSMIPHVEVKLVTLPEYSGGYIPYARMIHSKYAVVDDQLLWLGTSNWSKGYFYNSRNIELILKRPEVAQSAQQIFQKIWTSMYAVPLIKPQSFSSGNSPL
jgi:phosphatidylserine/phosphatidylglycerophosphate/cardiolipin synthase-like enzyme